MTKNLLSLFLVLFVGFSAWAKPNCSLQQIQSSNFDFDDNIFVTPARIVIWDNVNQAELEVSTAYWALIKGLIHQDGMYKNFSTRPDFLRNFGDDGPYSTGLFKQQISQALERKDVNWKGPRWEAFVDAMSCPQTRAYATIITARMHAPSSIAAGLKVLEDQGLLPNLPDVNHIYPVLWPDFPEQLKGNNPAESKAKVMTSLLDQIEAQAVPEGATLVENADGTGVAKLHLWDFSDDDYGNFSQALETLSPQVKAGRWPHVKITLYYTGLNNPNQKPHSIVIESDGEARPTGPSDTLEQN